MTLFWMQMDSVAVKKVQWANPWSYADRSSPFPRLTFHRLFDQGRYSRIKTNPLVEIDFEFD